MKNKQDFDFSQFRINHDQNVDLAGFQTEQDGGFSSKKLKSLRADVWQQLDEWQERLYAESKQSLLIVLQAMDAAGKDSSIAKLTKNLNAQSCKVHSFKKPSKLEMKHDFLWRVHDKAPAQGEITVFNRSHYEEVLVVKVHGWEDEEAIDRRYQHINNFEALLTEKNTHVIKFMLHVSPEYQMSRFQSRLQYPEKYWKFNPEDLDERALWDDYMQAFSMALSRCSTETAPWYIVPAENRRFRDYMIATVVLEKLKELNPQFPAPEFDLDKFNQTSIA